MIRQRLFYCLFFLGLLAEAHPLYSQLLDREAYLPPLAMQYALGYHYSPPALDNAFSKQAFQNFIDRLDPSKRFFTQEDIQALKQYEYQIDDEFLSKSNVRHWAFFEATFKIYDRRVAEIQKLYPQLLNKPLPLYLNEKFESDSKKRAYPQNAEALKKLWVQLIEYQNMTHYLHLLESKKLDLVVDPKLEAQARNKVLKELNQSFKNIKKEKRTDRLSLYLDSIMTLFDPHTSYLGPEEKESFSISIRGTLEGIGAVLKEEDGFIKVSSVIPGGPAWRQKELKAEDMILKVAQGDKEPLDIVGMRVTEAVTYIRGKKGTAVRLTVKKPQGTIVQIPIIRDVVEIEETYAKSTVITTPTHKKIGYLVLPVFYHDFDKFNARNAADDIAKELKKLNQAKVDGVILDLRNNSGGALEDAIRIAGFFIKTGPVVQVRDNQNNKLVREDTDSACLYDGPLVVLINGFSASASEIVAAALQDYGRGVIMGSVHSYGKGTVQTVLDFDRVMESNPLGRYASSLKPLGSLKVTIQKFYRIDGGATQYKGVLSDIVLPDPSDYVDAGERTTPHSLKWDTIEPAEYKKWTPAIPLDTLKKKSSQRLEKNALFKQILQHNKELTEEQKKTVLSLNMRQEWGRLKVQKKENEAIKKLQIPSLYILVPTSNIPGLSTEKREVLKEWYTQISKDPDVEEASHVIEDFH